MKKQTILGAVLVLAAVGAAYNPRSAAQANDWRQISIPPLPAFKPQQPKRIVLPNGMVIFLQEDHELPLIDGTARIRGGSHNEPAKKVGLIDIYGEVWRTGGSKTKTGDEFDDFLEIRAAKVETSGGPDSTSINWSCLKFREDKLDIAKKGAFDSISRRNDQIGEIAQREATRLAYGPDNPYARVPEYATVAAITRQDLIDWHKTYVHPNNMILGVSGDFDSAAVEAKLRAAFAQWPKGPTLPKDEVQYHPAKPAYYLIRKEDVNQSSIHMVGLGIRRDNPDYYAVNVFNEAFAGGFSSRLFNDIRTKRGLAYHVGGGIGANFGHPGILQIVMGTKSQTTIESVQALQEDIDDLEKHPLTDDELKRAKDAILNAFIFRLDSPDKILGERMTYEFYGYPADWLDKYPAEIQRVTPADANRVAAKYLHKDQLATLVVGNDKEFDKPLSSLGPVKEMDITIPPPPGSKEEEAPKPTASNAEGNALVAKVVTAMGGEAKLAAIKSLKAKLTVTQKTPQGDLPMQMESIIVYPDHLHAEIQAPQGTMTIVVTPDSAFASSGMGIEAMPAERKTEALEQIKRDPIFIASHSKDPGFVFQADGGERIGDLEARIVDVNAAGAAIRWYIDPQTGHILRETYKTLSQQGPVEGETQMENWKTVDGITIPMLRRNKQNGQDSSSAEYNAIEFNPSVDEKIFEKPADKTGPAQ